MKSGQWRHLPEFEFLEIWRFSNRLDLLGVVSFGFVGSLEFVVFRCVVGSGIGLIMSRIVSVMRASGRDKYGH